jgi:transcriptional regulator with XRE-family HTH domain
MLPRMAKKLSHLARNLKRIRESQGLSQSALSQLAGVNQSTIGRIEADECSPTWAVLEVLRDSLGCSTSELTDNPRKASKSS